MQVSKQADCCLAFLMDIIVFNYFIIRFCDFYAPSVELFLSFFLFSHCRLLHRWYYFVGKIDNNNE